MCARCRNELLGGGGGGNIRVFDISLPLCKAHIVGPVSKSDSSDSVNGISRIFHTMLLYNKVRNCNACT